MQGPTGLLQMSQVQTGLFECCRMTSSSFAYVHVSCSCKTFRKHSFLAFAKIGVPHRAARILVGSETQHLHHLLDCFIDQTEKDQPEANHDNVLGWEAQNRLSQTSYVGRIDLIILASSCFSVLPISFLFFNHAISDRWPASKTAIANLLRHLHLL